MLNSLAKGLEHVLARAAQIWTSIFAGLVLAIETTTVNYFVPCMLAILIDVFSAVDLAKRVKKKYPETKISGKFQSSHKFRVLKKMAYVFVALILGYYVDKILSGGATNKAQVFVLGAFLFYEIISILENFSSESDNVLARVLQRILINKAERLTGTELSDFFPEKPKSNKDKKDET